jgi:hypothetical protein
MKDSATCLGEHRTLTVSVERLPHLTMKAGSAPGNEPLLDRLPIGIHASGRGVFLCLGLPTAQDGFQAFLGRHAGGRTLPAWTLWLVFPRSLSGAYCPSQGWFARSSKTRCTAISSELKWYLDELRTLPTEHPGGPDGAFRARQGASEGPRFCRLNRHRPRDRHDASTASPRQ